MELRESIPGKSENSSTPSNQKVVAAQEMADKLASLQIDFNKSFEGAFHQQRMLTDSDWLEFLGDAVGIFLYLTALIGVSAIVGWLISLAF